MEREDGGERGRKVYLTNGALKLALSTDIINNNKCTLVALLWQRWPLASQTRMPRVLGTVNLSGFKETIMVRSQFPCPSLLVSCPRSGHPWRQAGTGTSKVRIAITMGDECA